MITYDPEVIRTFAQRFYERAALLVFMYTAAGMVIGATAGKFSFGTTGMWVTGAVAGVVGLLLGTQRAFLLKLEAQMALCQLAIEANTRGQFATSVESGLRQTDFPRIADPSVPSNAAASVSTAVESSRTAVCPSCDATIPLSSLKCPKCRASFEIGSPYKLQPSQR